MAVKVADASIIAAIAFEEGETPIALAMIAGDEIFVPTLLSYELASIARTKIRRYPERREFMLPSLDAGLRMNLRWVEVDHAAVVRIALASNLSTYDASYLQIARALGAPLLTFDQKLLAASRHGL